jgi:hypothetical protein
MRGRQAVVQKTIDIAFSPNCVQKELKIKVSLKA